MYRHIYDKLTQLSFDHLILVTQYHEIIEFAQDDSWSYVKNRNPEKGISHSIKLGLETLLKCNPNSNACMFAVGDQPYLSVKSLRGLIQQQKMTSDKIVLCGCGDRRGNPVIFHSKFYAQLLQLEGDVGGKSIISKHLDQIELYQIPEKELEDLDVKNI